MEMDYNLKKTLLADFGEIAKDVFIVCSSLGKSVNISLPVFNEQFYVRKGSVLNI